MYKCELETDCAGKGTCCFYCLSFSNCKSICELIDINKTKEELKQDIQKCDWSEYEEDDECGIPYTDLWVKLKYTLEMSEYCKGIREKDTSPAFGSALCQKCIDNKCRFIDICIGLHEMNKEDHEDEKD
jgi:hypothetical protein